VNASKKFSIAIQQTNHPQGKIDIDPFMLLFGPSCLCHINNVNIQTKKEYKKAR